MNRYGIVVTFDEAYEFIKLYDILRDMDFELTALQESVFEKIEHGRTMLRSDWQTVTHTTAYTLTIHYNEYIHKGLMKYNSPYEIGIGDVVIMTDEDGYKTDHLVLINYIKGETDAKGYTPESNRTILIDDNDNRIICDDFTKLRINEAI